MEIDDLLTTIVNQNVRFAIRQGVVSSISSYGLTITLSGGTDSITTIKYVRSYIPRVNDVVWVVINSKDIWVLGSLAEANRTLAPTAQRTTNQTLTTATTTAVSFSSVDSDGWTCWSAGSPTRLTAPITGRYMAIGTGNFTSGDLGIRQLTVRKNATTDLAIQTEVVRNVTGATGQVNTAYAVYLTCVAPAFTLAATEYIELYAYQNNGGNLDLVGAAPFPSLSLIYLGP